MTKINHQDLTLLRDYAIKSYIKYPYHCRLNGMTYDLNDEDKRCLAYFEAALQTINRLGLIKDGANLDVMELLTVTNEVTAEDVYKPGG